MIWKDRKYINPRKRVFKNMDTEEILNLELQDDLNNIEEESETPLTAHNLNQAQQDILDDMSKTYKGTSITEPTVEGYGKINKIWGHTIEEGTGEKSPNNPWEISGVGNNVNLLDISKIQAGTKNGVTFTLKDDIITLNGTCTADNTTFMVDSLDKSIRNIKNKTTIFVEYLAGNIQNTTNTTAAVLTTAAWTPYIKALLKNENSVSLNNVETGAMFSVFQIRIDNNVVLNNYKIRIKVSQSISNIWSPYNYGTVEIISQNGDKQSSNTIYLDSPLFAMGDGKGNIVAQDYIDYSKGKIYRRFFYIILDGSQDLTYSPGYQDFHTDRLSGMPIMTSGTGMCSHYNVINASQRGTNNSVLFGIDNNRIFICDQRFNDVESFKNELKINPITIIIEIPLTIQDIDCSNQIVQYADKTTISNPDGAKIEVTLTNNKAISEINEEMGLLRNDVNTFKQGDTDWIDIKLLIGNGSLKYRKIGNVVNVTGNVKGITGQWQTVANLPEPITDFNLLIPVNSNSVGSGKIQTNGNLILYYHDMNGGNFVTSENISINCTYITSEPAKINNVNNILTEESSRINYSTTEQVVGTWLGKKMYCKVIDCGNLPNATEKNVSTGLTDVEYVKIEGYAKSGAAYYLPLPFTTLSTQNGVSIMLDNNSIKLSTGIDRSNFKAYVIVYYTKV